MKKYKLLENAETGIYFKLVNLDKYREKMVSEGKHFMIDTSFDMLKLSIEEGGKTELIMRDTIYSARRFGPQRYEPPEAQAYTYQCKCGAKIGSDNIGEYCINCGTTVERKFFPLSTMGWIRLPTKMLTPAGIYFLRKALSGAAKKDGNKFDKLKEGKEPFRIDDSYNLYSRWEEIIEEHVKQKSTQRFLLVHKEELFTSCFPVSTRRLRRFMIVPNGDVPIIQADKLSVLYTNIISLTKYPQVVPDGPETRGYIGKAYLTDGEKVYEKLVEELAADKKKTIKGEIYSTRNNYSARVLIEPDNHLKVGDGTQTRVGYDIFRTLEKPILIKILQEEYNMSVEESEKICDPDFKLNKDQKKLLRKICKEHRGEFYIHINRPPTIHESGIMVVEIVDLCEGNIIFLNPILIALFQADFDGDTISVYGVDEDTRWRVKIVCSPRKHSLWWDRSLNGRYGGVNDQVVTTHMVLQDQKVEFLRKKDRK